VTLKHIKHLAGIGSVYRGDQIIEKAADYEIDVFQKFVDSGIGGSEIPAMVTIRGRFTRHSLPLGELTLVTAQYRLVIIVNNSNGAFTGAGSFTDPAGKAIDTEHLN
jgi:hypothetical protein